MINRFIVFRGRANPALAHLIARELRCRLGCVVAGAQPEFILAATHGQLVANAREKPSLSAVREVLVTDSVDVHKENRPEQRTVSIAPLLASALERPVTHGPRGELQSKSLRRTAAQAREEI
ncbi:hypothetical protein CQ12_00525 [Bradyrhizobium jicamae]|uniref:Ribose-phosphate pyrophosphokinase N-terminal domain-containing protein n=1 Tax=Bradyrhizobium jicamae TaxID=280332 RepID=A0A0R3LQK9_9BRAD|nr:hypothetical protein CQ12_00525 [Bradyrhizobium jicamae]